MTPPQLLKSFPGIAYRALNDGQWSIEYISDGCQKLLGLSAEDLQQQGKIRLSDILEHNKNRRLDDLDLLQEAGNSFQFEYLLRTANGEERKVVERGLKVFDENGTLVAIEGFVTEIGSQKQDSCASSQRSIADGLTGLPNQNEFAEVCEQLLKRLNPDSNSVAMLYIDLDQSHLMHQSYGAAVSGELLRQVMACLHRRVRRADTLAHLDGDAFGLLLENCSLDEANYVASTLCRAIEQQQFVCQQQAYSLTASIGVACSSEALHSYDNLLTASINAHYAAKDCGRNRVHYHRQQNDLLLQQVQEIRWALEIPKALSEGRFYLEQQVIDAVYPTGSTKVWYEILPRMIDVDGKIIMPEVFMPASTNYQLATAIDEWVIESLLQQLGSEFGQLDRLGLCFISLSAQSMTNAEFLDKLCRLLTQSQLPAERFCFQITEIDATRHKALTKSVIRRLHRLGCQFALDDFGSGLASLGLVRDLAVDFIKIDGAYVDSIEHDPVNRSIVASIKDLGRSNSKQVIAKSAQTAETLEHLRQIGVDFAQGNALAPIGPLQSGLPQNMDQAS